MSIIDVIFGFMVFFGAYLIIDRVCKCAENRSLMAAYSKFLEKNGNLGADHLGKLADYKAMWDKLLRDGAKVAAEKEDI